MGLKQSLRKALAARYGAPLRVGWTLLTAAQVAMARPLDAWRNPKESSAARADVADVVTVMVKTFERPRTARRLIRSLRRYFDGRIVVADDSRVPLTSNEPLVDVLALPFNSGVPAGRNAALATVTTEFCFVTDDDAVFSRACHLHRLVSYLRDNPGVDIAAVILVNLPSRTYFDAGEQVLNRGADPPLRPYGELIGGAPVRYKVPNAFLARTESLRRVGWDENLRMLDHGDFFSAASGKLVTVTHPGAACYHARTPFDHHYQSYRLDYADDLDYLARKWQ